MKKIIIVAITLIVLFMAFVLSTKGNDIARAMFVSKYSEQSDYVKKEVDRINSKSFSKDEIKAANNFNDFGQLYDIQEGLKSDFAYYDTDVAYQEIFIKNKKQTTMSYDLLNGGNMVVLDKMNVNTPIPAYQEFRQGTRWFYVKLLKRIRDGDLEYVKKEFININENKIRQLLGANTFIKSLVFLDLIKEDLKFAKYVSSKYDLKLTLRKLTREEYSLSRSIDSEMELYFSLRYQNPEVFISQEDENYYYEHAYFYINKLKEYFAEEIEIDNYKKITYNHDFGYIEEYGSPIINILANVLEPMLSYYKKDFTKYNYDVTIFNTEGYNPEGFDSLGFDKDGFNKKELK